MLLWRWKNGYKKAILWLHIALAAFVLNLLFGFCLFFYCTYGPSFIMLTLRKDVPSIPVTFVRYHAKNKRGPTTQACAAVQKEVRQSTKKISPKTSLAKLAPLKKREIKKSPLRKQEPLKKEIESKKIEKKEQNKAINPVVPIIPTVTQPSVAAPLPLQEPLLTEIAVSESLEQQESITRQQAELYALVAKQWTPPAGIAHDKVCEISAEIGWNHKATKVWINAKSGILMYDMAARKAVMQTDFPLWTCGKTVAIRFVQ